MDSMPRTSPQVELPSASSGPKMDQVMDLLKVLYTKFVRIVVYAELVQGF